MSALTQFRDHARQMATAEHKPECPTLADRWMKPRGWRPPPCEGCNPATDRALFARLADEIDEYLARPALVVDLFGEAATEPEDEPA